MSVMIISDTRLKELGDFLFNAYHRETNRQCSNPNGNSYSLNIPHFPKNTFERTSKQLEKIIKFLNELRALNLQSFITRYEDEPKMKKGDFEHYKIRDINISYNPDVFQFMKNIQAVSYQIEDIGRKSPVFKKLKTIVDHMKNYLFYSMLGERKEYTSAKWGG